MPKSDVVIVGAGIVGLAHALAFAKRGKRVVVLDRSPQALGASVRNFGMVWTIGQPPGELRRIALESNRLWRDTLGDAGLWHDPSGCLHIATHDDEWATLTEFHERSPGYGYATELWTPEEVALHSPNVRQENLRGGLYSALEVCVDPRQALDELPRYLSRAFGVEFFWNTAATWAEPSRVIAGGRSWDAETILLCTGDDYETLFPDAYREAGLNRCKLQMMRARPIRDDWRTGPMLCAGLTLSHYKNFSICSTLQAVKERLARDWPVCAEHGIHVLVSQHGHGEVTLGDTHHYGRTVEPFSDERLDQAVLEYLDTFLVAAELPIVSRWQGVYSTYAHGPFFEAEVMHGVHAVTGVAGSGMTLSFGLGERTANRLLSPQAHSLSPA